jgi:hypothetical protein
VAAGEGECQRHRVEVAAVVRDEDRRPVVGDVVDALEREAHVRQQLRPQPVLGDAAELQAQDRQLGDAGGHVEVADRPPAQRGERQHAGVGVDRHRVADGVEQAAVVEAVRVGPALAHVDVVVGRPGPHGPQLAGAPHELAVERAVVAAAGVGAVAGGDDVVEAEPLGERRHHVVRRGRGQDHGTAGAAVLVEQGAGERLDHRLEPLGGDAAGLAHLVGRPALGEAHGLAGEQHGRAGLAHQVEHAVDERLAGQRPLRDDAGLAHRLAEGGAAGAPHEGAVEVDERSGAGHDRRRYRPPAGRTRATPVGAVGARAGEATGKREEPTAGGRSAPTVLHSGGGIPLAAL